MPSEKLEEKTVLSKLNCLLEHHWHQLNIHGFTFRYRPLGSDGPEVEVNGCCIGRRWWDNLLQVVNAFAASAVYDTAVDIYRPFKGFECQSLEELAIKIDLASSTISK